MSNYLESRSDMKGIGATSLYVSVIFFMLYLFCAQWSASALFMDSMRLHDIFSILSNSAWILSFVMAAYRITASFKYYIKHKWFLFFSIISIALLALVSKSPSAALLLFIGFASIRVSDRALAKLIVFTIGILMSVSYIFSLLGLNGGDIASKPLFGSDSNQVAMATAMGLTNPNVAMMLFVNVVVLTLFLCRTRLAYTSASIVLFVLTIILGNATGSTTGLLLSTVSIVLMFLYKYLVGSTVGVRYYLRKITPLMLILVTIVTFVVAMNYGPSHPNSISDALTNRPYFWNLRIENGSFLNIYGDNDEYDVRPESYDSNRAEYYPLDNEPLYVLVHYGVIAYALFLYIFYVGSKKLKEPELLVYVFVACIAMFVEKIMFFGFVYIFLEKAIAEYHLLSSAKNKKINPGKVLT